MKTFARRGRARLAWGLAAFAALLACGPEDTDGGQDAGTGGVGEETGGSTAAGGASTGGSPSDGGSAASGGGSGGASGGTTATGGSPASGGSGGIAAAGGESTGGAASGGETSTGGSGGSAPLTPITVFIAGDSTVSTYPDTPSPNDQAGWGQMIHERFNELVTIDNRAIGGRTSRRFIQEGRLGAILDAMKAGDYLLVQFGTNDGHKTATYTLNNVTYPYYLAPEGEFKTYLREYIVGARARGGIPVLVTPPPRNSAYCTGGNGTGAHADAMRQLGAAEGVVVSDLNQASVNYLKAICPAPTPENFFLLRADQSVDGTHFQENGARILSGLVAEGIRGSELRLADYLL